MKGRVLHIIYSTVEVITLVVMIVAAMQGAVDVITASTTIISYVKSMWV